MESGEEPRTVARATMQTPKRGDGVGRDRNETLLESGGEFQ
jgi:hypothetical protein